MMEKNKPCGREQDKTKMDEQNNKQDNMIDYWPGAGHNYESLKLAVGLVDQSARILVLDSLPPFGLYPSKCRIWPVYHRHTSNTGLNPSINNTVQPFLRNSNMFRGALTFGVGIYAGIYLSQNYQIPRVDEPKVVWEKIQSLMEQYKKPPPTGDK
ncbi:hypothetical protein OUZ56_006671 [Daphnia magna]|uniref:Uncharacterized protein n=2 Tax=Daphnia magna TaxID=35525 RepID=A0ABQ9YWC6_9CRUS|nr:hypothetical protein OUZ56_006671 [Daphnia magna]